MEKRLAPEVPIRAALFGESKQAALQEFHHEIQSLRNQVKYRRQFILQEIPKDPASHKRSGSRRKTSGRIRQFG